MSTFLNIVHSIIWKLMANIQSCIFSMAITYRKEKTMKYIRVSVGTLFTVPLSFSSSMNPIRYSKHWYCCNSYPDARTRMTIQCSFSLYYWKHFLISQYCSRTVFTVFYSDQCLCCCRKQSFLMQDKLWVKMGLNPPASFQNLQICKEIWKTMSRRSSFTKAKFYCHVQICFHLCCLAGSTPTTFTLVLPISLQRTSTRRCRSRCSYSRGALRSTQCAPVCTTLLSTMPCQWVYPPSRFCPPALQNTGL